MVNGPVSRFAWAFNDPAFSDVQLVLRAATAGDNSGGGFCASVRSCDCNWQANTSGCNQRDVSHHTTRRACTKASKPEAQKSENYKIPTSGSDSMNTPAALRGSKWIPSGQTITEVLIHAHSIILASSSEMMRSWLSRWSDKQLDAETDSLSDAHIQSYGSERRRRRLVLRLNVDLAPNELAAGQAVVRFMYTQALDGVEDDEEILACMLLADRWLLPDCVAACAARLQSTPAGSLSWRVRAALLNLPLGLSAASPHLAQLQTRAEASLMRTFRCPELILDDPDNRLLLLSLPPDRLEQLLLSRQDVQVTSENVVLALLSAWLQHNCPPHTIPCNTCCVDSHGRGGSTLAPTAATAAAANLATEYGSTLALSAWRNGDVAAATGQWGFPNCDGGRLYEQEPRGGSGGGGGGGWDGEGGLEGSVGGAAGPPELEALLRLVRYRDLTPHYRTTVAPFLPGLRLLRLHHVLLAEASAAAVGGAVIAAGAAASSSSSSALSSSLAAEPPSRAPQRDAVPLDTSSSTSSESTPAVNIMTTSQPLTQQPPQQHHHHRHQLGHDHQQPQSKLSVHPDPHPQQQQQQQYSDTTFGASVFRTSSLEPGDAITAAVTAAGRTAAGSTHSSNGVVAVEALQTIGLCLAGSDSGGEAGTTFVSEGDSVMGNSSANSTSTRMAPETTALTNLQTARSPVSAATAAAPPPPPPPSATISLPTDTDTDRVVSVMTPGLAPGAAAAAAVTASQLPTTSLPRRLPYSMFRRIEWTRDIRDVRLHLTGVGGPLLGCEAASGLQLSPPAFLGGYYWHVATRFVPASPPLPPSGTVTAAPSSASFSPFPSSSSSSGRLQLQLGVVCTSPASSWAESCGCGCGCGGSLVVSEGATRAATQQAGGGGDKPLSIASCTVGLVDAAGRPAWQVVQAPCVLMSGMRQRGVQRSRPPLQWLVMIPFNKMPGLVM
ncbi:hypothetical protein Vafri_20369 [Volvox africanus]|uniref:BACK domain-containing protein n=1 Tax=Volvox africanus TaxID=51714 RepID=A0A8J4F9I9_9CHLO|nr:hypothetical protein Vafri_20369 [Volvox africanus]